jgi:hypothetical protein
MEYGIVGSVLPPRKIPVAKYTLQLENTEPISLPVKFKNYQIKEALENHYKRRFGNKGEKEIFMHINEKKKDEKLFQLTCESKFLSCPSSKMIVNEKSIPSEEG